MRHPALLLTAALLLAGCATKTNDRASEAVATPLSDLNVVKADIPPVLQEAAKAPYALADAVTCELLAADVKQLDEVLGPDLDAPAGDDPTLVERGGDAAVDALRRTAEGVVPFRGWIRKLTGAERHSRRLASAIAAGAARRAFLKGVAKGRAC